MNSQNLFSLPIRDAVEYWAEQHPGKIALHEDGQSLTYAELSHAVAKTCEALEAAGVGYGDRLAAILPSGVEFAILLFASMKMGVNLVPFELMLTGEDVCARLEIVGPKLVFAYHRDHIEMAAAKGYRVISKEGRFGSYETFGDFIAAGSARRDGEERRAGGALGDCAVLTIFTSGSTGQPKGVMLSEQNLIHANVSIQRALGCAGEDILLSALPMSHIYGVNAGILLPMLIGATSVLEPRFKPDIMLDAIERFRVSVFNGVPSMYQRIVATQLEHPRDVSSMRLGSIAGAKCEGLERYRDILNCEVRVLYGLTESPLIATMRPGDSLDTEVTGVGRFVETVEGRIVDDEGNSLPAGEIGEIVCKSPGTMLGYLNLPEVDRYCIDEQGWIHTDDNGYIDDKGYVHVVGRISGVINRGGYKVYPPEIESLYAHQPDVVDCCAMGFPHVELGQQIVLFVQLKESGPTAKELREYAIGKLAKYKIPDQVMILDALPLLSNGKHDKQALKRIFDADETVFHSDEERKAKSRLP